MIQVLANRMASYVAKNDDTADQEILAYGYSLIIMAIVTYTTVIASAFLFGVLKEMIIAICIFVVMRTAIGGCHANHRAVCLITYSGMLYLCIVLAGTIIFSWYVVFVLYAINVVLLTLYAPGDTVEQPMVKYRFMRKIFGLILISCIFALYIFFGNMHTEINILLLVSTSTCVLLHPYIYRIYGCKKSS